MARFNFVVIFCLLVACFLASADMSYAQIVLSGGHFSSFILIGDVYQLFE